jgi:hypothetical protein
MDRGKNADIRKFKKIIAPLDEAGAGRRYHFSPCRPRRRANARSAHGFVRC